MSSKEEWIHAYETIVEDRILEFFNKYQRYPNETEELMLETQITEDQIRDALSSMHNEDDGHEF